MDPPERIVQVYLRLNGFFTISKFSILSGKASHIDMLAIRLGGSKEIVGSKRKVPLKIDYELLKLLGVSENEDVGLVIEIKGGLNEQSQIPKENFEYTFPFFGSRVKLFRMGFERSAGSLCKEQTEDYPYFRIPISHCLEFVNKRFEELKKIEPQVRDEGDISKYGSWYLSEESLSELIYLKSLGYFEKPVTPNNH